VKVDVAGERCQAPHVTRRDRVHNEPDRHAHAGTLRPLARRMPRMKPPARAKGKVTDPAQGPCEYAHPRARPTWCVTCRSIPSWSGTSGSHCSNAAPG
jgi:hypothetical protein